MTLVVWILNYFGEWGTTLVEASALTGLIVMCYHAAQTYFVMKRDSRDVSEGR